MCWFDKEGTFKTTVFSSLQCDFSSLSFLDFCLALSSLSKALATGVSIQYGILTFLVELFGGEQGGDGLMDDEELKSEEEGRYKDEILSQWDEAQEDEAQ